MGDTKKIPLSNIDENWIVKNIAQDDSLTYKIFKEAVDLFFGCVGFLILSLFFPLAAFLIKVDSKGSIIYKQERIGKGGRKFLLYKFRTMYQNEEGQMSLWREKDKNNITRVGKVLRKTHLDEIPQAFNLIKGDISFIGPRAEWSVLAKKFEEEIPFYKYRHVVKPGIIGWAQVSFPPSRSVSEAREKFEYDLYYLKNRSIIFDLVVIFKSYKLFFW